MSLRRFGATPAGEQVRFEAWAPDARAVTVVLDDGRELALAVDDESVDRIGESTWVVEVDGVADGDGYRFRLDGGDPLPDPASRRQPDGVHGASAVVDPSRFEWTDDGWRGVELADAIIYELHVGTFTSEGTFDAAIGQLDRLAQLGVTVLEVMPVNAFPGSRNWGYDGVFPSAVQETYGGPGGLARFVDAAHARGLAVVLDVVYNHWGPEGNVLHRYAPYFTDSYRTPWGPAVNVADAHSDAVRRYLTESAVGWVRDFHVDGLRLDAVQAIVDPTASPFVAELTAAVHAAGAVAGRTTLVTLESSANDPRMVRSRREHGWAADAMWNDDVHHGLHVALTGERHEYYVDYTGVDDLVDALENRWVFHGRYSVARGRHHGVPATDVDHRQLIAFTQNHDHVGNTPSGKRLLHDAGPTDPRLRLAAATILLSPFTPLLFMGEEYGEQARFPFFVDHSDPQLMRAVREGRAAEFAGIDWSGDDALDPGDPATFELAVLDPAQAESGPQQGLLSLYTELIRIRRTNPVLSSPVAEQTVERHGDVVVLRRRLDDASSALVLDLGPEAAPAPDADGDLVVDTSSPEWGGDPDPEPTDGLLPPWSARLHLA